MRRKFDECFEALSPKGKRIKTFMNENGIQELDLMKTILCLC